jgi:hypothetical protein
MKKSRTPKQLALETLQRLSPKVSWYDIHDRLFLIAGIAKAQAELKTSRGYTTAEVKKHLRSWVKPGAKKRAAAKKARKS